MRRTMASMSGEELSVGSAMAWRSRGRSARQELNGSKRPGSTGRPLHSTGPVGTRLRPARPSAPGSRGLRGFLVGRGIGACEDRVDPVTKRLIPSPLPTAS